MKLQAGALLAATLLFASVVPLHATTIASYSVSDWSAGVTSGSAKDANFSTIQNVSYGPSGYTTSDGSPSPVPTGRGPSCRDFRITACPHSKGITMPRRRSR
jgi:hypothetical protein